MGRKLQKFEPSNRDSENRGHEFGYLWPERWKVHTQLYRMKCPSEHLLLIALPARLFTNNTCCAASHMLRRRVSVEGMHAVRSERIAVVDFGVRVVHGRTSARKFSRVRPFQSMCMKAVHASA
jgi:hypothetical protein